jgi:hypothetical protein
VLLEFSCAIRIAEKLTELMEWEIFKSHFSEWYGSENCPCCQRLSSRLSRLSIHYRPHVLQVAYTSNNLVPVHPSNHLKYHIVVDSAVALGSGQFLCDISLTL